MGGAIEWGRAYLEGCLSLQGALHLSGVLWPGVAFWIEVLELG